MIKLIKNTFFKQRQTSRLLAKFIGSTDKLSFGPECEKFEKRFAKFQGRKYCIFVNSGSSANLALIQALVNLGRLKKRDRVGFSAVTWSTNTMPLIQSGLEPVPVDVELDTLNVSSRTLIKTIGEVEVKALFLTNLLGFCDDMDEIKKICSSRKILLLEDNCESLGTVYKGKKLGNFGLASTFSFYVGHHMSTIEGGAICTDDEELAVMLRIVRAHGWDRNLSIRDQNNLRNKFKVNSTFYSRYTFYDLGYNLRPTEISGFLGNNQLSHIDEIIKKRNENFIKMAIPIYELTDRYYPVKFDHIDFLSNFAVPVVCRDVELRNKLVKVCNGKVEIRPIVGGNIVQQPFFKKYVDNQVKTPNSELIHKNGLYFGNNPDMTDDDINSILKIFVKIKTSN